MVRSTRFADEDDGKLLFERASVLSDDFLGDGMAEVSEAEPVFREIGERAIEARERIEGEGVGDAALSEDAFLLLGGGGPPWPDADMDAAFVADGGEIGRQDFDHSHIACWKRETRDSEGGDGLDITIGAQGAKCLEKVVGDFQSRELPVILDPDEQIGRLAVRRKVIGKGADSLGEFVGVVCGDGALDAVGLQVGEQGLKFGFSDHDFAESSSNALRS
jgi:hypothetical protein